MSEVQEQTFDQQTEYKEKGDGCSPVLKVLGIGCLILILAGIGIGVYAVKNFKKLAATATGAIAKQAIKETGMPENQQKEFNQHIDRVVNAYKEGKISDEQLGRIVEELTESPLVPMTMILIADKKYVQPSGLTAEEKEQGTMDLQRYGKGVIEKKIQEQDIQQVTDIVTVTNNKGEQELRETLTDEEVKKLLETVKATSDAVGIPQENFEINPAEEFGKAIDKALGDQTGGSESSN